jgi:hypothetical protein
MNRGAMSHGMHAHSLRIEVGFTLLCTPFRQA